jgi:hypothetical protein
MAREYNFDDLKSLLVINELDLLDENIKQTAGYHYWSAKCADADRDWKRTCRQLDTAEKNAYLNCKKEGKCTDAEAKAKAGIDPEVVRLQDKAIDDEHYYNMCKAAVKAMDHRLDSLGRICSLDGRNYFNHPRHEAAGKQAHKAMSDKLNNRNQEEVG